MKKMRASTMVRQIISEKEQKDCDHHGDGACHANMVRTDVDTHEEDAMPRSTGNDDAYDMYSQAVFHRKRHFTFTAVNRGVINVLSISMYLIMWYYLCRNVRTARLTRHAFDRARDVLSQLFLHSSAVVVGMLVSFCLMTGHARTLLAVHSVLYSYAVFVLLLRYAMPYLRSLLVMQTVPVGMVYCLCTVVLFVFVFLVLYYSLHSAVRDCAVVLQQTRYARLGSVLLNALLVVCVSFADVSAMLLLRSTKDVFSIIDHAVLAIFAVVHVVFMKCYIIISVVKILKRHCGGATDEYGKTDGQHARELLGDDSRTSTPGMFMDIFLSVVRNIYLILLSCFLYPLSIISLLPFIRDTGMFKGLRRLFYHDMTFTLVVSVHNNVDYFGCLVYENKRLSHLLDMYSIYSISMPFSLVWAYFVLRGLVATSFLWNVFVYFLFRVCMVMIDSLYVYGLYFIYDYYKYEVDDC